MPVDFDPKKFRSFDYSVSPAPDLSGYHYGILTGVIALFIAVDFLANRMKPLPAASRWRPTMWVGVLAGVAFATLQSNYDLTGADAQKIADVTSHPLASGIGTVLPALLITLGTWFYSRRRVLSAAVGSFDTLPKPSTLPASSGTFVPELLIPSNAPAKTSDPFEIAGGEVLSGKVKAGLWARALVEAGDNEIAARAAYVRLRVTELQG